MENEMNKRKSGIILSSVSPHLAKRKSIEISHITEITRERSIPLYSDHPCIWICFDGNFSLRTENEDFFLSPGAVAIVPAGTVFCPETTNGRKVSIMRILMEYNICKDVDHATFINSITHLFLPAFSKELGFSPAQMTFFSEKSLDETKKLFSSPSLKSIEKFFSLPEFALSEKQKKSALSVVSRRLLPVLDAMTYIQGNYSQKITGEYLAKEIGLCRTNLFTFFKRYLSVSPLTYLIMIRVIRAQFALTHTQYSLQYISDMCGFANCSHMSRCYRQYKGFLPREDRAKMRAYRKKYPEIHVSHDYFFNE